MNGTAVAANGTYVRPSTSPSYTATRSGAEKIVVFGGAGGGEKKTRGGNGGGAFSYCVVMAVAVAVGGGMI